MSFFNVKSFYISLFSFLSYILAVLINFSLPPSLQQEGLIKSQVNISNILIQKADSIIMTMQEKELAANFLCNIRNLNYKDKIAFEASGLIHLLAISGSQITPITNILTLMINKIIYLITKEIKNPIKIMKIIYPIKIIFSIAISFIFSSLFGWSGALIRVVAIHYFIKTLTIQKLYFSVFNIFPFLSYNSFVKSVILILFSLFFGNLCYNISFLLSFIGATSLSISNKILSNMKLNIFYHYIISTIITTMAISLILLPFSNANILYSCLSNLVAIPIVCFIITPLTIVLLVLPESFYFFNSMLELYDKFLFLFKLTALIFSDGDIYFNNNSNHKIYSIFGILYLNLTLLILVVTNDLIKERKISLAREKLV